MPQIIDLRKKQAPPTTAQSPEPLKETSTEQEVETGIMAEPIGMEVVARPLGSPSWLTHIARLPQRERVWYAAGTLAVAGILVAYFAHDLLFTIVLFLAALVLILNMYRPHHPNRVSVHATGVSIDDRHHHFADMKSFWIEYQPYLKEISIEFKKSHLQRVHIPLEDVNPLEIRQAMVSYVPEKPHEQSLLDHLIRVIGI